MFDENSIAKLVNLDEYKILVREVCRRAVQSPITTYIFLERYAHINGFAGSGVALLAGNIGYSRDMFLDKSSPSSCSDKGMLVASKVFAATIDEHADRQLGKATHRVLAQVMLDAVARYAGLNDNVEQRNTLDNKSDNLLRIVEDFKNDYRGGQKISRYLFVQWDITSLLNC